MLRILDRYVIKTLLINYVLSLFVLISLYVVLDLFVNLDEFTKLGQPWREVLVNMADYYFFNIPLYFSQLAGVITLFAACATLARMQRLNEITAILSSGTSLYRISAPIIVMGLAMNALLVFDHELILPRVAPKLARERSDVRGERIDDVWCVRDGRDHLFNAQRFSYKEGRIGGLIVFEYFTDPSNPEDYGQIRSLITAYRAKWNPQRRGWDLTQEGYKMDVSDEASVAPGQEEAITPEDIAFYPSELSPDDLLLRKGSQWIDFLSLSQLSDLRRSGAVAPGLIARVRHSRFTLPISNMVLLLLGISFFMNRRPDSVLSQGTKALVVCSIAFLTTYIGQQAMGASGDLSQPLPHWLPILIFGPIAGLLLQNVKT